MSNLWRVVNPALNPPQVHFESGDEQAVLREFATRNAAAQGHKLVKSEDDGKTWMEIEHRAPDPQHVTTATETLKTDEPTSLENAGIVHGVDRPKSVTPAGRHTTK